VGWWKNLLLKIIFVDYTLEQEIKHISKIYELEYKIDRLSKILSKILQDKKKSDERCKLLEKEQASLKIENAKLKANLAKKRNS